MRRGLYESRDRSHVTAVREAGRQSNRDQERGKPGAIMPRLSGATMRPGLVVVVVVISAAAGPDQAARVQ